MTQAEAARVVAVLVAGFPREAIEDETTRLWISELMRLDARLASSAALEAAVRIVRTGDRFPTWREFRAVYLSEVRRLAPPALEEGSRQPMPEDAKAWLDRLRAPFLAGIEESRAIVARPVWARWERRRQYEPMLAPTDEEKRDAILVLRELGWNENPATVAEVALVREAERIMIEAA